jgi:hypothetical protein
MFQEICGVVKKRRWRSAEPDWNEAYQNNHSIIKKFHIINKNIYIITIKYYIISVGGCISFPDRKKDCNQIYKREQERI